MFANTSIFHHKIMMPSKKNILGLAAASGGQKLSKPITS